MRSGELRGQGFFHSRRKAAPAGLCDRPPSSSNKKMLFYAVDWLHAHSSRTRCGGGALAMLDCRARAGAQVPFDGAWRRRLALKAAAAGARIARRGEDEATLRDAFLLATIPVRPGRMPGKLFPRQAA
jgi:hypothetical protein